MQRHLSRPISGLLAAVLASAIAGCSDEKARESRPITPSVSFNKPRAPIGSPVEITYRFEVGADAEPIAKDYSLFVHFLDSHDALLFTDDHKPPEPTSSWKAGAGRRVQADALHPALSLSRHGNRQSRAVRSGDR